MREWVRGGWRSLEGLGGDDVFGVPGPERGLLTGVSPCVFGDIVSHISHELS